MAIPIGTLGTIPTLTVGGRVYTDLSTLITLHGWINSNTHATLRKAGGSSGYAVTTGKTLTISSCALQPDQGSSSTAAAVGIVLLQSDNDVGIDTATAFTNPVYLTGAATAFHLVATSVSFSQQSQQGGLSFAIAALKYTSVLSNAGGAGMITTYGYET